MPEIITSEHIKALTEGGLAISMMIVYAITFGLLLGLIFQERRKDQNSLRDIGNDCHKFQEGMVKTIRQNEEDLAEDINKLETRLLAVENKLGLVLQNQEVFKTYLSIVESRNDNKQ